MTPEQQAKFDEFQAIREAVGKTTLLRSIFDETWFEEALPKNKDSPLPGMRAATPFFHGLPHPLDDIDKFNTVLALLDHRLKDFAELPFKKEVVNTKIKLLRTHVQNKKFLEHFFEINVLGDLALKRVLRDIEVFPDPERSQSNVDGVIDLEGRPILIEATNTTEEIIPPFNGSTRVMAVDTDCQFKQVFKKLHKKVAEDKQLARAKGRPTVLFFALTYYGADRLLAEIELNECFRSSEFATLSGVVLADSWKFQVTSWHPGITPDIALTEVEKGKLQNWYAKK